MQKRQTRFLWSAALSVLLLAISLLVYFAFSRVSAVTTTPTTMNFQGRLLDSSGVARPDGLYNMQFRLYTVSSGGTAVWTETRETTNRVQVTGGLFSTRLGAVTPIPASLFASGNLFFEITMATPATATCSTAACAAWEAAMTPRHTLATSAYAMNAETLDGLDSSSFAAASGSTNYIQNQATLTAVQPSSNLWISGTARADTSILASTYDTASAVALNLGSTTASGVNIGKSGGTVSVKSLTTAGPVITNASGQLSSAARLSITYGGTNASAIGGAGTVAYSTGSAYAFTAAGTSGQCLQSAGTASPTWGACGTSLSVGAINGQTKSSNGAVLTSNTLYLQTADASNPGLMSTGAQIFSGDKIFRSNSTAAFEIQNASAGSLLKADTTTNTLTMGSLVNIQGATANSTALQVTGNATLKATVTGTAPATYFNEGFESGNMSQWTIPGSVTVTNSGPRTGSYRADIAVSSANWAGKTLPANVTYASFTAYVKMPTNPSSVQYFMNMDSNGTGGALLAYDPNGGSPRFYVYSGVGGGSGGGSPTTFAAAGASWSTNAWNKVELQFDTVATTNNIKVYLNDTLAGTWSIDHTGQTILQAGIGSGGSVSVNMQYDDILVTGAGSTTTSGGNLVVEGTTTTNASSAAYTQRLCHDQANGALTNLKLGDCAATGQADLAEMYATDGKVEPGDIVAPIAAGGVMGETTKPYQANMIGIVSTNPIADGIIGWNEKSPTRQPIALAGRVPLKVSRENGDIHAGDPLTASSTPGVAMRATKTGRIIGYALEDYTQNSLAISSWVAEEEADRNKTHAGSLPSYTSNPAKWPTGTGKIMVFANASFSDPSFTLQGASASLLSSNAVATDSLNVSGFSTIRSLLVTDNLTISGHLISNGRTPSIATVSACNLDNLTISGTDMAGEVSFVAREGCETSSGIIQVKFATAYTKRPYVVVTGASSNSKPFIEKTTVDGFTIGLSNSMQAGNTYRLVYHAIE